jgi:putative flippase GtrA
VIQRDSAPFESSTRSRSRALVQLLQSDRPVLGPLRGDHVRFGLIGGYNTAFSYLVFVVATVVLPGVHYLVALLISHVLGVLNAYVAYRLLVFRVRGHWLRDLFRFWVVYLGAFGLNLLLLPFLVEVVGLQVLVAQLAVVLGVAVISWFGHKHISFRRPVDASISG